MLYDGNGRDNFAHEQNLVISENQTAVILGCGHSGIVNIMKKAEGYHPKVCVGGFHLFNPVTVQAQKHINIWQRNFRIFLTYPVKKALKYKYKGIIKRAPVRL